MGLEEKDLENLKYGAMLHDIGKIELGSDILNKTTILTDQEFERIKKHPIFGENMLKPLDKLRNILPIIRNHHERYDGRGYLDGLTGEDIPLLARIVAVADSFDAMTTIRPYKVRIIDFCDAKEELIKCSGSQFDPQIVQAFIKTIDDFIISGK
jgi:HD-GYP domain-containing protein (c-di-GMP phosphodiesterase class II)